MIATEPVQMIATDIDGTMLRPDGTLSSAVRQALHDAHDAGVHVVPATGRPLMISQDVIEWLGLNHYWIFANGAYTWHAGRDETVRTAFMPPENARDLVTRIRERLPSISFAIEFERDVVYESGFGDVVPSPPPDSPLPNVLESITKPVQKILVYNTDSVSLRTIDDLYVGVGAAIAGVGVVTHSGLPFVEVSMEAVTKATGVAELAEHLGIPRTAVASFGDNHNDVSMLEWTGRSYAMGNASADAMAAADEVIGTNIEDGLATKVRELLEQH